MINKEMVNLTKMKMSNQAAQVAEILTKMKVQMQTVSKALVREMMAILKKMVPVSLQAMLMSKTNKVMEVKAVNPKMRMVGTNQMVKVSATKISLTNRMVRATAMKATSLATLRIRRQKRKRN
ncbi:hypothetical protein ACSRC8_08630 [Acinetobacter baumannii]|uniref:hypothetical protein n=1 Tax=Acinetobacter baumannii TaxID=470 RepID=UPI00355558E3